MSQFDESTLRIGGPQGRYDADHGPGDTIAGRYALLRDLGTGGMADVYEGRDLRTQELVAVKLPSRGTRFTDNDRERFLREGRMVRRLDHPAIVHLFDAGVEGDMPFLVMERLDGLTLHQTLTRDGPLPIHQACQIMVEVLGALSAAHAQRVVHRDVKPSNIFLMSDGGVKLLDFGLARGFAKEERITASGVTVGTPMYMAPEQLLGFDPSDRGDQYSAGVTLYEALCNQPAFRGSGPMAMVIRRVVQDAPASLRSLRPEVPEALAHAITRALSKLPDERHSDCDAFRTALVPFCVAAD